MEGRPLYRTVAAIGLAAHALSSLVHVVLVPGDDKIFFGVILVVAAVAAGVTWSWSKGIWVSLVVGILLEITTFWFVFPIAQGFALSALDAVPAMIGFVGVWTAIIASILGVMRRREPREFSDSTRKKVLTAVGVIAVLGVASTALTMTNKTSVSEAEATGATTVLMHNGDEFTPRELNAEVNKPMKLLLRNDDPFAHMFAVKGYDEPSVDVGPGSEKIVTFTPTKAGTLTFVCDFHGGMKGTIKVS